MAQYTLKSALKFLKAKDVLAVFRCIFIAPFAFVAKIFIRDFWLICEDENEARDNGYWLFKWIRENHPEQKVAYAINKQSVDFCKVKDLGKIISYGSCAHWFWYIVADKNISSQKGGKPNAAVCYFFEVVLGLRKNNRVFLQHGIIINLTEWLFYPNTKFAMFVTTGKPEYEFIKEKFGYPDGIVKLLGLCRFDNLLDAVTDQDLILVMPTWRNWLGRESTENAHLDFAQTEYCRKWNEFLQCKKVASALEENNKRMIFFPHRNMQKFIDFFHTDCDRIEIADRTKYDVQDLLKRAAVLITDYSSVFVDFAYMRKPVLFYQFDEKEFRAKQYAEGYLDYHNTVLGKWAGELNDLLPMIEELLSGQYKLLDKDTVEKFFPYHDDRNCSRTYTAIKEMK